MFGNALTRINIVSTLILSCGLMSWLLEKKIWIHLKCWNNTKKIESIKFSQIKTQSSFMEHAKISIADNVHWLLVGNVIMIGNAWLTIAANKVQMNVFVLELLKKGNFVELMGNAKKGCFATLKLWNWIMFILLLSKSVVHWKMNRKSVRMTLSAKSVLFVLMKWLIYQKIGF